MTDEGELVTILSADIIEADLVMGLLEQAGIQAFLQDEMAPRNIGFGARSIRVAVAQRDLAEAQALLRAPSESPSEAQP